MSDDSQLFATFVSYAKADKPRLKRSYLLWKSAG